MNYISEFDVMNKENLPKKFEFQQLNKTDNIPNNPVKKKYIRVKK